MVNSMYIRKSTAAFLKENYPRLYSTWTESIARLKEAKTLDDVIISLDALNSAYDLCNCASHFDSRPPLIGGGYQQDEEGDWAEFSGNKEPRKSCHFPSDVFAELHFRFLASAGERQSA